MARGVYPEASVVVSGLEKIDSVIGHEVHDSVFLREPPRPHAGCEMPERLRLADPGERISEDCLDEIQCPECDLAVSLHPVPKIFQELLLKHRGSRLLRDSWAAATLAQARCPCEGA